MAATNDAQIAELKADARAAHDRLTQLAAELNWATDGTLPTAVLHIEELVRRLRAEAWPLTVDMDASIVIDLDGLSPATDLDGDIIEPRFSAPSPQARRFQPGDVVRFSAYARGIKSWAGGGKRTDKKNHTVIRYTNTNSGDLILDNGEMWSESWLELVPGA